MKPFENGYKLKPKSPDNGATYIKTTSNYADRGVSSQKADVHAAIANLDKGIFPNAFCKILQHRGNQNSCRGLHADTAGSIPSLASLVFILTNNLEIAINVAINAAVMNLDDVGCIGAFNNLLINQTIGINTLYFGKKRTAELTAELISKVQKLCEILQSYGIEVEFCGGETASVGNNVRTFDVGNSVYFEMQKAQVIDAGKIVPGDYIVGFSSTGKADWEQEENSSIGSNGLTSAVPDLLSRCYRRYKETFAPELKQSLQYRGKFKIGDLLPGSSLTIAEALLSPTRTYLPLMKKITTLIPLEQIHGMIHCSGGGQTKIKKFGRPGNLYLKDNLFPTPAIFNSIQRAGTSWKEMYEVYNMGHRLELVTPYFDAATTCIELSKDFGINAQIIGRVVSGHDSNSNGVRIESSYGNFDY
ncbi:MAG: phosphoribosylformylglycinamidine cyclo-ligase [bacterium]